MQNPEEATFPAQVSVFALRQSNSNSFSEMAESRVDVFIHAPEHPFVQVFRTAYTCLDAYVAGRITEKEACILFPAVFFGTDDATRKIMFYAMADNECRCLLHTVNYPRC
ncbi:hypothetical protein Cob_v008143 [Colletotrichum orbiculare MAFF 240422]|uniref:Uncharacterized protein n=1 Tax=Colletotrichum orbiculare (strain 104-T / ATCC 96160 / CBS 514.97 / LARS 414 / MAFF 240422) TaxID=1213857 RepID=A0A484FN05_COLOR|nr:hypothetical protein Cob_v008143 [Colletotrichum orbiculare MAFF 240422]